MVFIFEFLPFINAPDIDEGLIHFFLPSRVVLYKLGIKIEKNITLANEYILKSV